METSPLDEMEFETPYPLAEVNSDAKARCSRCGLSRVPRPMSELVAIRHRDPAHPSGSWRIYCPDHLPAPGAAAGGKPAPEAKAPRAPRAKAAAAPKRSSKPTPMAERPPVICPRCFVQVPAIGVCDSCGDRVG